VQSGEETVEWRNRELTERFSDAVVALVRGQLHGAVTLAMGRPPLRQ
jgi:hypothetical protein